MNKYEKNRMLGMQVMTATAIIAGAMLLPDMAMAATNAAGVAVTSPVDSVYTTLVNWTKSGIGRIIALLIIVVGISAGIIKQSLFALVIGVGAGLALNNADTVVSAMLPASLNDAVMASVNGASSSFMAFATDTALNAVNTAIAFLA